MSQAGGQGDSIGSVRIDVRADASGIGSDVESAASKAKAAGEKIGTEIEGGASGVFKGGKILKGLLGYVFAPLAIAREAVALIKHLEDISTAGERAAQSVASIGQEFARASAYASMPDARKREAEALQKIELERAQKVAEIEQRSLVERATYAAMGANAAEDIARIEDEAARATAVVRMIAEKDLARERADKAAKALADAKEQTKALADAAALAALDGEAKIQEARRQEQERNAAQAAAATDAAVRKEIASRKAIIDAKYDDELRRFRAAEKEKADEEKKRADEAAEQERQRAEEQASEEMERTRKAADAQRRALEDFTRDAAKAMRDAFDLSGLEASLETIVSQLRAIKDGGQP